MCFWCLSWRKYRANPTVNLIIFLWPKSHPCCYLFNVLSLFRLEQPYLNANTSFFEALSCCSQLRRLCLISRSGTFDPLAVETFMEQCSQVIMCHMFMGGTLVACRTLQKSLLDRLILLRVWENLAHFRHKMEINSEIHLFLCVSLSGFQGSVRPWV